MQNEETLDKFNPERRLFIKKMLKTTYVVPAVVTVAMVDQKLDLSTAHAQSGY